MKKKLPKVVIVGRANVGKSTLFNRLSENVKSLIFDHPGVTRDFITDVIEWQDRYFELVDTGGIDLPSDRLSQSIKERVHGLLHEASIILFIVDGKEGVVSYDQSVAEKLKKYAEKVVLVVNKTDAKKAQENVYDFYELPHERLVPVSAEHGTGISELFETIIDLLPDTQKMGEDDPAYRVVFLGRPNVGKSSLMNTLLKQDRMLISDEPGTTREALSERITFYHEQLEFTDTPGIRRQRSVEAGLERLMVKSSFQAMKNANFVVLLLDVQEGRIVDQELKLAFYAFAEQHKGLIILVNKVDVMTAEQEERLDHSFERYEHLIAKVPTLRISCKTGKNIGKVVPLINTVSQRYYQQLPEDELEQIFKRALDKHPLVRNRQHLLVRKVKQLATGPITIGLQVNFPEWFGPTQLAFFENIMRKTYDLVGVPVRFVVKKRF
jgi:GTP-binding protein